MGTGKKWVKPAVETISFQLIAATGGVSLILPELPVFNQNI